MDIGDDKTYRRRTLVFDPVRSGTEFSERLTGLKFLDRAVVMVVGEHPTENIDNGGIALMAVQTDMAARRHDSAAEAQLPVRDAVDLRGEIDRGEDLLADRFVIRRRGLLPENKACGQQSRSCTTQREKLTTRPHLCLLYPVHSLLSLA